MIWGIRKLTVKQILLSFGHLKSVAFFLHLLQEKSPHKVPVITKCDASSSYECSLENLFWVFIQKVSISLAFLVSFTYSFILLPYIHGKKKKMSCLSNFMDVFILIIDILVHFFKQWQSSWELLNPMVMRVWKERQDVQCWEPKCVCQKRDLWWCGWMFAVAFQTLSSSAYSKRSRSVVGLQPDGCKFFLSLIH